MGANASRDVAIIGGGIGGLTAALAFARMGAKVSVYEQAAAISEVGAGLQITPNGARALHGLGLENALDSAGLAAAAVIPSDALTGRMIARFDLTRQNPVYRFLHRADLIGLLAQACADHGAQIVLNARIAAVAADGSFDTGAGRVSPSLTIGADGLHSILRPVLNGTDASFFTGQVAWRAIIPASNADPVARIWMAPGRHLVTYPLPGKRLNIVAVQERATWAAEGWHHTDDPAHLRAAFADCVPVLRDMLAQVEVTKLWGLFRHPVADHWHGANTAILGDAAHPTLPFLAQGANLAIEDAYVLARCCDKTADLAQALQAYQTARRPRVARAIAAANANARNYHLSGLQRKIAHTGLKALGKLAPDAFINRLGWLYNHDVTSSSV
ncbi:MULTISPECIES: FAD-dependent monooxygenase [unclassified Yoonia]|uniref:FAD-dependent monooxygenase n=1 Tax=unclassified Yoonia TaxID=2629118 RepID=UPI002AFF1EFB|nr:MULTISPECIES: FAD-dependent monooxygenase [unclassified Yoonia]